MEGSRAALGGACPLPLGPGKNQECPSTLTPGLGTWVPLGAKERIKSRIREALKGDKAALFQNA